MKRHQHFVSIVLLMVIPVLFAKAQSSSYNQTSEFLNANAFWAFYDGNGLDFSSGAPVHVPTSVTGFFSDFFEHVSAVSDPSTGELLFYTNGRSVWNRNHQLMPNGANLYGNYNTNAVQGTCIVPFLGDSTKYYLFSLGSTHDSLKGLYYSVVDMALLGGMGDVVSGSKNIPVDTTTLFNEAMVAIPGNNCNVWLVTHTGANIPASLPFTGQSNEYLVYEISSSGINTTPVVSTGMYHSANETNHLAVSPDRSRIMMTCAGGAAFEYLYGFQVYSELSKFDPNTGLINEGIAITPVTPFSTLYTSAFSPDNDVLYFSQIDQFTGNTVLTQVDISVYDSSAINASAVHIPLFAGAANLYAAALKSYRDSIYVFYLHADTIGRINRPNSLGTACDFTPNSIQLPTGSKTLVANAPGEVVYPVSLIRDVADTLLCSGDLIDGYILKPYVVESGTSYLWNDSSHDTLMTITNPGTYWVSYTYLDGNCMVNRTDTFVVDESDMVEPQININVDVLGTAHSYSTYQWMFNGAILPGETDSTYTVSVNGDYQVIVTNEAGCVDTSEIYKVENQDNGIDRLSGLEIKIYPNPTPDIVHISSDLDIDCALFTIDGKLIIKRQKGNVMKLSGIEAGIYILGVYDPDSGRSGYFRIIKLD